MFLYLHHSWQPLQSRIVNTSQREVPLSCVLMNINDFTTQKKKTEVKSILGTAHLKV